MATTTTKATITNTITTTSSMTTSSATSTKATSATTALLVKSSLPATVTKSTTSTTIIPTTTSTSTTLTTSTITSTVTRTATATRTKTITATETSTTTSISTTTRTRTSTSTSTSVTATSTTLTVTTTSTTRTTTTTSTTTTLEVAVLSGELVLSVSDSEEFATEASVQTACRQAIAEAVGAKAEDVVVQLERSEASEQRRLGGLRGLGSRAARFLSGADAGGGEEAHLKYWVRFTDQAEQARGRPLQPPAGAVDTLTDTKKMNGLLVSAVASATNGGLKLDVKQALAPKVETGSTALQSFRGAATASGLGGGLQVALLAVVGVVAAIGGAVAVIATKKHWQQHGYERLMGGKGQTYRDEAAAAPEE
eukprot:CAMPEP_0176157236 /NCGR_PEP_ID=MMETSP0120_2-20121206/80383_1 /TAXON_ID=160619 /ORGANISM="Kryptoperidinium foliaceum, Strain CCMP 1326" /LENGTH=366 /DNA_ID=CAMNT_0017494499 /DNA_START=45 /DNA_END=1142 /DNA_ORIENTATION=+